MKLKILFVIFIMISGLPAWAGGTYTNSLGMEFVEIPAGRFDIGSCNKIFFEDCGDETGYRVTIEKPFYLGKTEVTQGQWEAVMDGNPSDFKGANRPVEEVSWQDVQVFIERLNVRENCRNCYRLPTEAEWEYAARAGGTGEYGLDSRGWEITEKNLAEYAWYGGNSGGHTHPVAQKKPNAWGLYDMHGNVWEWICSAYTDTYDGNEVSRKKSADRRVFRGGSWGNSASNARSAYRYYGSPDNRYNGLGFRLARIK